MGDEHHGGAALLADVFKQHDDLRLDRHVQRRGGLVGHDQLGLSRQRQRNHHTLAHAARELVRVVLKPLGCGGNAGVLQQGNCTFAGLLAAHRQMRQNSFSDLRTDRIQRVKRRQRVLKNRTNAPPADMAHGIKTQVVNALALQQNLAPGNAPRRLQQANDGSTGERFARTRFTHHAQNFARRDVERDVVNGPQGAVAAGELDNEVFDLK